MQDRSPEESVIGKENRVMFDLLCLVVVILFFALGAAFVRGCEKLEKEEE